DLHRVKAGTDVGWMFHSGAWLGGQVAYYGLYGDRRARTTASFSLDPQRNTFTSLGDTMDRHNLELGLRTGMALTDAVRVMADYSFVRGKRTRHHLANATVSVSF
ncbi:MAG: autotransporter outer membrane beta-barrel domain-containing protein, partial [Planctomycetes bacterium]|nr:autotransporter outer membrane beta-barrel domain-containing protein [Planctomycetota bacterium]